MSGLRPSLTVLCLAGLTVLAPTAALSATAPALPNPGHSQRVEAGQVPAGLSGSDWASIQAQITASQYRAYRHRDDGFASANPAHGWQIHYAADGTTRLQPRDGEITPYHLALKLSAVGFGELHSLTIPQRITADDHTVTYQWNDSLREWWVNTESGLEQWFELDRRPAGAHSGQPLTLAMTLATNLTASQQGNALRFIGNATTIGYSKLKAWDAGGRELPARMQLLASELRLIIDDRDAVYPLTIDPNLHQQAYLKASNTGGGDVFGQSVAISGDTVVVGAYREDSQASGVDGAQDGGAKDSGAAYVFTRSGMTWSQQAYLKASNTGNNDQFGYSVAIAGDTVVVGATGEESNATGVNGDDSNDSVELSGAAYVFTRSGMTWSQQAYLKASNTGSSDQFGYSVAIAGDTVVVGAQNEESNATGINGDERDNSLAWAGAAYVFTRSGITWSQQAYLKASNTDSFDQFGYSVAIAGDTVVVGATGEDSNATGVDGAQGGGASASGAAYVFTRSGITWSQQAYLKASNTDSFDNFGWSVAISGDTVVVGAFQEESNATGVNGDDSNDSAYHSGAAYVFTRSGMTWSQQAYLKASNTGSLDQFGYSVAIAGDTVVVGARNEESNATGVNGDDSNNSVELSGAAYVFTRSGMTWSQQAYLKASNTDSGDHFGGSVAIAGDTVVVGAQLEDSIATGVDGNQGDNSANGSGAAYVFAIAPDTATFAVTKEFIDGDNPTPVEITLACNTGLPITQTTTINEIQGVNFVVTHFAHGALDCSVTEQDLNDYTPTYQASGTGPGAVNSEGGSL